MTRTWIQQHRKHKMPYSFLTGECCHVFLASSAVEDQEGLSSVCVQHIIQEYEGESYLL